MKKILFLIFPLIITACSQKEKTPPAVNSDTVEVIEPDKTFSDSTAELVYIQMTEEGGFNIYSRDKQLILEYTKRNTDSISLEILKDIFLSSRYYNSEPKK